MGCHLTETLLHRNRYRINLSMPLHRLAGKPYPFVTGNMGSRNIRAPHQKTLGIQNTFKADFGRQTSAGGRDKGHMVLSDSRMPRMLSMWASHIHLPLLILDQLWGLGKYNISEQYHMNTSD